jgi:hypothetical protein
MHTLRLSVVILMTAGTTSCFLSASSWAASPSDARPDFEAAVQQAGQSAAVEANPDVSVPQDAESAVSAIAADGSQLRFSIPAQGAASVRGETIVFDGTSASNSVAVQRTTDGVRALVGIAAPEAAERYAFTVSGDAASLAWQDDGSVLASRADGTAIGRVETPWARDANGAKVPTHYEIAGTTLTQVIDHRSGPYAYPIVADPFWDTAWKVTKCAAAVGATLFVGSKAYKIVKELGGAWNAAKLLVRAGNFHDFAATAGAAAAGVLGIETIRRNCF